MEFMSFLSLFSQWNQFEVLPYYSSGISKYVFGAPQNKSSGLDGI